MDRLSNLQDPILCHILSFLPTKTSVATTILSQRWQSLWTSVDVLDIQQFRDIPRQPHRYVDYADFVDKVVSLPWKFPFKTFRCIHLPDDLRLRKWIAAAGGAEELDLSAMSYFRFERSSGFRNVRILKLSDCDNLTSVESGLFPKLRVLHLRNVSFGETRGGSLENFLAACPVLEQLVLEEQSWPKMCDRNGDFKICVPTLTSLVVWSDMDERAYDTIGYILFLETPALEYLSFSHDAVEECLQGNLCKLRRADIDCYVLKVESYVVTYAFNLIDHLSLLSSVEFLKLSCDPIRKSDEPGLSYVHGLVHGLDYSWLEELPVFHNLVRLEIHIPYCDCVVLPHLLHKFRNLEHIAIEKLDTETAEACWNEPLQVPICLSSSLLSFSFQGFDGFEVEMKLVEYVMKHATVLKNLTLDTSPNVKAFQERVAAIQRLPMGLRVSKACQVNLST